MSLIIYCKGVTLYRLHTATAIPICIIRLGLILSLSKNSLATFPSPGCCLPNRMHATDKGLSGMGWGSSGAHLSLRPVSSTSERL